MSTEYPRIEGSQFPGMGTALEVQIVTSAPLDDGRAKLDILEARAMYAEYEKTFSRFDRKSELSSINEVTGAYHEASPDMVTVAEAALSFHRDTDGLYDPRVIDSLEADGYAGNFTGGVSSSARAEESRTYGTDLSDDLKVRGIEVFFGRRMDFSGIVKGYVTDRIAGFLSGKGWRDFSVDSGGDMYLSGRPPSAPRWHIAVDGLDGRNMAFALSDESVATSGISKRRWVKDGVSFHHLIHPKHPDEFAFGLRTVTVVAKSTIEADVRAKQLFLMGREAGIAYSREHDIMSVFLDSNGVFWASPSALRHHRELMSQYSAS